MRAAYFEKYAAVEDISIREVEKLGVGEGQVLVRNMASSINFGNFAHLVGKPFLIRMMTGWRRPKEKMRVLGGDIAGVVEAVGTGVENVKVGDEVIGDSADSGFGAMAEYVLVKAKNIAKKPRGWSMEESATLPLAAAVAWAGIVKKGGVKRGESVLICGATGGVGSFAVQIAKSVGAQVSAVCGGSKVEYVKGLGADTVIDYQSEDFVKRGEKYDLVVNVAGYRSLSEYKKVMKANARYVSIGGDMKSFRDAIFLGPWYSLLGGQKMMSFLYLADGEVLAQVSKLAEEGKLKAEIDQVYELEEVVQAFRAYEHGGLRGKIVIKMG
jgi:NADPH:quinone reductase-like Zn-dependent oxidoreductase